MNYVTVIKSSWVRSFRPQKSFIWRQKFELNYLLRRRSKRPDAQTAKLNAIVSLTSFPRRLKHLHLVIKSLLANDVEPKKIVLYLDSDEMSGHKVPKSLSKLQGGIFEIRYVRPGHRSFSKLVHALVDFKNENILTVDDDYMYSEDFLSYFKPYLNRDDVRVVSGNGKIIRIDSADIPYQDWPLQISGASDRGMVLGYTGVLYKPKVFSSVVLDSGLYTSLCPHNDDVWFTCCARMNGVSEIHFAGVDNSRNKEIHFPMSQRLMDQNISGRLAAEYRNVIKHFGSNISEGSEGKNDYCLA